MHHLYTVEYGSSKRIKARTTELVRIHGIVVIVAICETGPKIAGRTSIEAEMAARVAKAAGQIQIGRKVDVKA